MRAAEDLPVKSFPLVHASLPTGENLCAIVEHEVRVVESRGCCCRQKFSKVETEVVRAKPKCEGVGLSMGVRGKHNLG